jgi:hypothetical protein
MEVELCFASVWRLDRQPGLDWTGPFIMGGVGGCCQVERGSNAPQQMRDGDGLPSDQPEAGGTRQGIKNLDRSNYPLEAHWKFETRPLSRQSLTGYVRV